MIEERREFFIFLFLGGRNATRSMSTIGASFWDEDESLLTLLYANIF